MELTRWQKVILWFCIGVLVLLLILLFLSRKEVPEKIEYGISFNTLYAEELGLNPKEVYTAFLDDLGVSSIRLAAHWNMIEPEDGKYDFSDIDFQIKEAEKRGVSVILGVGRRLPRWPECHVPKWASKLSVKEQQREIKEYIREVVERYKNYQNIIYWQVENEPFLSVFAYEHCGELDVDFLDEEIELVRELNPTRPILITDSGNLGAWSGAYQRGDVFGTSVYVYFWNPDLGKFRTVLPPWFYRVKENVVELFYEDKETILIELSLEPWLLEPIVDVPVEIQYSRMDVDTFREVIEYARNTRYGRQYLWGGEWWYWLKENGQSDMWEEGKKVFSQ